MRLGYVPYDPTLQAAGDRRRFVAWARDRDIQFELLERPQPGFDVVVVSTAADLTRWRNAPRETKIVYDLTDDYLGLPDSGFKNRARGVAKFLTGEISRPTLRFRELLADMCRRSDFVVVTSQEQLRRVTDIVPAQRTRIILDAYDDPGDDIKRDYTLGGRPRIVWEGLPYNVATLAIVDEALRRLDPELRPEMHVVTLPTFHQYARRFGRRSTREVAERALPGTPIVMHDWIVGEVVPTLAGCDLGIIPLPLDDRFAMSKSAQKLVGMWSTGLPVIASATPAYSDAMRDAGLDLVCRTTDEWHAALVRLLTDEAARRDAGTRGRAYVDAHATRERILSGWDVALRAVGATLR